MPASYARNQPQTDIASLKRSCQRAASISRQAFLIGSIVSLLQGCGFSPIYAPDNGREDGPASRGLAEISVALIPERYGQLLRQALQSRFYGDGTSRARLFELKVRFSISNDSLAIQSDNTATRARMIGSASWTLTGSDPQAGTVASGIANAVDGYNIFDQQYFAADLASEAAQRRVAEAVADRITLQLAVYFKKNHAG